MRDYKNKVYNPSKIILWYSHYHILSLGVYFLGDYMTKVCKKCKNELSVECFHKNKNSKDGLADWCKECTKQAYIKNREKRLKYQRDYKNADVERFKEQQKRYRKKSDYYKKYE